MSRSLYAHEASFYSEDMHLVRPGRLTLTVPLMRDVIQINAWATDDKARLVVERDETSLFVAREDGAPMQVAVNGSFDDNHKTLAHPVFLAPVPAVTFATLPSGEWHALEKDILLPDSTRGGFFIGVFADTVGHYALLKQARERLNRGELPID